MRRRRAATPATKARGADPSSKFFVSSSLFALEPLALLERIGPPFFDAASERSKAGRPRDREASRGARLRAEREQIGQQRQN